MIEIPTISEDFPTLEDFERTFDNIRFYGESNVATTEDGEYLGIWEFCFVSHTSYFIIRHNPNFEIISFNKRSGKATFAPTADRVEHEVKIMHVVVPPSRLKKTLSYLEATHPYNIYSMMEEDWRPDKEIGELLILN